MPASKLMPLYAQVARRIEEQIETGDFRPGQRIYSIREICEHFAVADVTAKKALTQLRRRGLIRTVNGSGAFVTDEGERQPVVEVERRTVGFIKIGLHPAIVFSYEIDLLQQELARLDHAMVYAVAPTERNLDAALQQMERSQPGCLLIFPPHRADFNMSECMTQLKSSGLPVLLIESRQPKGDYITTDTERATVELADYLYELGHRRICLATGFGRKVAGFERALQRWRDPAVRHWILSEPGKTDTDTHVLAEQILALKPRPTAVIANDDHAGAVLVSHFLQRGLGVPDDISVVTYGDHPQYAALAPVPMTVMRHPFLELAQEAAQWAHRQMLPAGRARAVRREITGTLIIRDSSGPPPA